MAEDQPIKKWLRNVDHLFRYNKVDKSILESAIEEVVDIVDQLEDRVIVLEAQNASFEKEIEEIKFTLRYLEHRP